MVKVEKNIHKTNSGKYRITYYYGSEGSGKKRTIIREYETVNTLSIARRKLREFEAKKHLKK